MSDVWHRLNLVRRLTAEWPEGEEAKYSAEFVALQLRKLLELIAFGTLCANRQKYSEVYENFRNHWRAAKLLQNLERVHPDFYPTPLEGFEQSEPTGRLRLIARKEGFLTRADFGPLYDRCCELLHTPNPFAGGGEIAYGSFRRLASNATEQIDALLHAHTMRLAGGKERWVVQIRSDGTTTASICIPSVT
jgi:hypothetical protein